MVEANLDLVHCSGVLFPFSRDSVSETEIKVLQVFQKRHIEPMKVSGSAEVRIEASWGGDDKTNINIGMSGEFHDNSGFVAQFLVKHLGR